MYTLKFNPLAYTYTVKLDGKEVEGSPFGSKHEAKTYIKSRTTGTAIVQKSELETKIDPAENTNNEEVKKPEEPKKTEQEIPKKDNKTSSLFDDIAVSTEQDKGDNDQFKNEEDEDKPTQTTQTTEKDRITTVASEMLKDTNEQEDDAVTKRKNAQITAILIVEFCEIAFSFLCQWIAKDFSKEKEKRYSLSPEKKKAIQIPLQKLLELRKKKTNPVLSLILAILASFAPMVILAFSDRKQVVEREKEAQRLSELKQQQHDDLEAWKRNFIAEQELRRQQEYENSDFYKRAQSNAMQPKEELARPKFVDRTIPIEKKESFGKQMADIKGMDANGAKKIRYTKDGRIDNRGRKAGTKNKKK